MDAQSISLRAAASDSATSLWNSDSTGRSSVCTTFLQTRQPHISQSQEVCCTCMRTAEIAHRTWRVAAQSPL